MKAISILFDDDYDDEPFDKLLHDPEALPDGDDLLFVIKKDDTEPGKSIGMLTFIVKLPDGFYRRVKIVKSLDSLIDVLRILEDYKQRLERND